MQNTPVSATLKLSWEVNHRSSFLEVKKRKCQQRYLMKLSPSKLFCNDLTCSFIRQHLSIGLYYVFCQ